MLIAAFGRECLMTRILTAILAIAFLSGGALSAEGLPRIPPTEPANALQTFRLQDGFRLELLAAEPLVTDPVAMVYDENGRAYVVEMNDYPFTDPSLDKAWEDQQSAPIGRVRLLEDDNGDGVFDRSTVFSEGLSWPTGIACWKGGVYVTATPDIWYLKDTDSDGKADVREQVFTGFRKFNVQAVINNLQWGLDHKLYAAGSSNGGSIVHKGSDGQPIALGRNDFRFDPNTGEFEVLSGGARFGNTFDDWGNRFICNIRNPVQHIVLEDHYLKLNPSVVAPTTIHDSADAGDAVPVFRISPPEPWREVNAARLAAENRAGTPRSEMNAVGFVTSAAGATVYRGGAYPEEYVGNVFVGEVAGNLLIRYRLEPDGATFRAVRTSEKEEFLASTDNWFRPVNLVNAPDGTLHLLDMYRETIEHPWSIPDDIKSQLDLTSGRDRGRIYRLVPPRYREGYTPPSRPQLGSATTPELVATLESPHSWWRETAQRLIFERQDALAVPFLADLVGRSPSPLTRLHALYSLDSLSALSDNDIRAALNDVSPRIREHAIRLAERHYHSFAEQIRSALRDRIAVLGDDVDARVRLQALLTLAAVNSHAAQPVARAAIHKSITDRWVRLAARLALTPATADTLFEYYISRRSLRQKPENLALLRELVEQVAARGQPADVDRVVHALLMRWNHVEIDADNEIFSLLLSLCERLPAGSALSDMLFELSDLSRHRIGEVNATALLVAGESQFPVERRVLAIRWLSCGPSESRNELIGKLLDIQQPQEIQRAAIDALAKSTHPHVADILLDCYPKLTPALREQIILVLLARTDRQIKLFHAIEAGMLAASDVPSVRRSLLLKSSDPATKSRAEKLFGNEATPAARRELIARYRAALAGPGDPAAGRTVFTRECANCHRLGGEGHDVGPALVTVRARTSPEILEHILDPNREVSPHFLEYVILQNDGTIKTGAIASETPTSLTLRQPLGKQETVLRSDIDTVTSSGKSLMPEGLEQKVTPDEMRNLIEYVRTATQ